LQLGKHLLKRLWVDRKPGRLGYLLGVKLLTSQELTKQRLEILWSLLFQFSLPPAP
jgi:hypothetical protein